MPVARSGASPRRCSGNCRSRIDTGSIRDLNNDHVLSPDGPDDLHESDNGGHVYAVAITGGEPRRVSNEHANARITGRLHGISPDGADALPMSPVEGGPVDAKRISISSRSPPPAIPIRG